VDPQTQKIVMLLVIGAIAGWLASFLVGGGGLVRNVLVGVIGAFVGGYLLRLLNVDLNIGNPLITDIATATIGAIVVIVLAKLIA
jgi:uncharacterized membrane protein YeaQ/YmgE (transglycosylase-associated protein family)